MTATAIREARLFDAASQTSVMIALSNAMYFGPSPGLQDAAQVRSALAAVIRGGCDAVMLTPGALRAHMDLLAGRDRPGIVLSAAYTNAWRSVQRYGHGGRASDQALFLSVEEAVRLGADAFHVYMFLGLSDASQEAREVERIGTICEKARSWGMPVLCEPLARGDRVPDAESASPENVALCVRTAAEVGADLIKVEYTGTAESFQAAIASSYVPVVMMGGAQAPTFDGFLDTVGAAVKSGARGLAVGRNIYSQPDPAAAVARVVAAVRANAQPPQPDGKEIN